MSLVIMTEDSIICARDKAGKLPILIGKRSDGYCFSFESFAYQKLGYETCHELKAGEITKLTKDGYEVLYEGTDEMKICTFLWTYYGYPTACYEGVNVEVMRTKNGEIMAENDMKTESSRTWTTSAAFRIPAFLTPSVMQTAAVFRLRDLLSNIHPHGREALCQPISPCETG